VNNASGIKEEQLSSVRRLLVLGHFALGTSSAMYCASEFAGEVPRLVGPGVIFVVAFLPYILSAAYSSSIVAQPRIRVWMFLGIVGLSSILVDLFFSAPLGLPIGPLDWISVVLIQAGSYVSTARWLLQEN
jgi:hypothetical protein